VFLNCTVHTDRVVRIFRRKVATNMRQEAQIRVAQMFQWAISHAGSGPKRAPYSRRSLGDISRNLATLVDMALIRVAAV